MLELRGLSASYGAIRALKDVSLTVPRGSRVTILGANGAGKSTLLKAISGVVRPSRGSVWHEGADISGATPMQIVARGIAQVPEGRQLFSHLTVADNLHLGAYLYHDRKHRLEIAERLDAIYATFPVLRRRAGQVAGTLSGGEQQMVAIGRALMTRPRLLLLDEPSMGLAPLVVQDIFKVIRALNDQGTTILLVEQNARAALQLATHGYVLETGSVALAGPAADLLADATVRRAYLGG